MKKNAVMPEIMGFEAVLRLNGFFTIQYKNGFLKNKERKEPQAHYWTAILELELSISR